MTDKTEKPEEDELVWLTETPTPFDLAQCISRPDPLPVIEA